MLNSEKARKLLCKILRVFANQFSGNNSQRIHELAEHHRSVSAYYCMTQSCEDLSVLLKTKMFLRLGKIIPTTPDMKNGILFCGHNLHTGTIHTPKIYEILTKMFPWWQLNLNTSEEDLLEVIDHQLLTAVRNQDTEIDNNEQKFSAALEISRTPTKMGCYFHAAFVEIFHRGILQLLNLPDQYECVIPGRFINHDLLLQAVSPDLLLVKSENDMLLCLEELWSTGRFDNITLEQKRNGAPLATVEIKTITGLSTKQPQKRKMEPASDAEKTLSQDDITEICNSSNLKATLKEILESKLSKAKYIFSNPGRKGIFTKKNNLISIKEFEKATKAAFVEEDTEESEQAPSPEKSTPSFVEGSHTWLLMNPPKIASIPRSAKEYMEQKKTNKSSKTVAGITPAQLDSYIQPGAGLIAVVDPRLPEPVYEYFSKAPYVLGPSSDFFAQVIGQKMCLTQLNPDFKSLFCVAFRSQYTSQQDKSRLAMYYIYDVGIQEDAAEMLMDRYKLELELGLTVFNTETNYVQRDDEPYIDSESEWSDFNDEQISPDLGPLGK